MLHASVSFPKIPNGRDPGGGAQDRFRHSSSERQNVPKLPSIIEHRFYGRPGRRLVTNRLTYPLSHIIK